MGEIVFLVLLKAARLVALTPSVLGTLGVRRRCAACRAIAVSVWTGGMMAATVASIAWLLGYFP